MTTDPGPGSAASRLLDWLDAWHDGRRDRPLLMGILNVTPDSFSDGGRYLETAAALKHAERMIEEGADIVDIGGESTRPGSRAVLPDEQARRVLPVIERLRASHADVPISIDTRSAEVARAAIEAGADCVNDISAMRDDPGMAELVAAARVPVVLMHMQGTPATMQANPRYTDVVSEVGEFLAARIDLAVRVGIDRRRIIADPGIGFGKTTAHNLALLRHLAAFRRLGVPLLVGASRKRLIAEILGLGPGQDRLMGSAAAVAAACLNGADILRVHDVAPMRQVVELARAVRGPA